MALKAGETVVEFKPPTFPICSTCDAPYILRRALVGISDARYEWIWQRDCKHYAAPPQVFQPMKP